MEMRSTGEPLVADWRNLDFSGRRNTTESMASGRRMLRRPPFKRVPIFQSTRSVRVGRWSLIEAKVQGATGQGGRAWTEKKPPRLCFICISKKSQMRDCRGDDTKWRQVHTAGRRRLKVSILRLLFKKRLICIANLRLYMYICV